MGLPRTQQTAVVKILNDQAIDWKLAVIELAQAILDLDQQLRALERKVEHAELLAGRHAEECGP